jgi:hypothetical protein
MDIELRHPAVRDLAWVIGSPPLLESGSGLYHPDRITRRWCQLALRERIPWLKALDDNPAPLEHWLADRPSRLLGYYFEALIGFWLRHWPQVQFVAARAQVREAGRGIGEFDFLFRDKARARTIHWETAVKFFLRHRDAAGHYRWLGPNPRDTLEGKLSKVFGHQLRMGGRPEAAPVLEELGVSSPQPEAFIKGYLFYPAEGDWVHPEPVPAAVATDHLRGWWTRAGERCIPTRGKDSRWMVLERLRWLSPARAGEGLMDRTSVDRFLDRHFAASARPLLLAELSPGAHEYREVSRGFVVPDKWPANPR